MNIKKKVEEFLPSLDHYNLEGHSLELLTNYNQFSFEANVKKYIQQEINRIVASHMPPEND